ncbi:MAG: DNA mismatch repair protein MutS [Sumerlaeia bacterium]
MTASLDAFSTPMMRQYAGLKREYPDAILFFRCGDFYETYAEDAEEAGRLLNIIVTRKGMGKDGDVAMAGVPYHAAEGYIAKLVRAGKRVAVAEQTEDPKQAKGLVRREVMRVVTPGTATDEALLEDKANNYLVALCPIKAKGSSTPVWGVAVADVSTGFFALSETSADDAQGRLLNELERLEAKEILLPDDAEAPFLEPLFLERNLTVSNRPRDDFRPEPARQLLLDHFRVQSLEGYGAEDLTAGIAAAGALLRYLKQTQRSAIAHIADLRVHFAQGSMVLDAVTQRSLELVRGLQHESREGTLLSVIDRTQTPMGGRMMRAWLLQPLCNQSDIESRLEAVGDFVDHLNLRTVVGEALRGVRDLERIVGRASIGNAGPRDLGTLREGLRRLPALKQALASSKSNLLKDLSSRIDPLDDLADTLAEALVEEPPTTLSGGQVIREGFSPDLDEIKFTARNSKDWIAQFRAREAQRVGAEKLKVGFNKVFGYYIELTKAQLRAIGGEPPEGYIRKQTIANGERFITQELKEKEDIILHAEDRIAALEAQLFDELRRRVADRAVDVLRDAEIVAQIDCLRSLAETAISGRYVRPQINDDGLIEILDGRHPVLEAIQTDPPFVANDVMLSPDDCQVALITGPNMAGKSTYIRQAALLTLMAHMGSFVPARSANIALVDRIFTRVGAHDALVRGQSTFLVEMTETANILRNATSRSLVILDEIGRGTSTYDGLSIAWAVCEYLYNTPGQRAKTLFATHYHELTALEAAMPRLRNFHVAVLEEKQRIVFLYKLIPGPADESYGIHAAEFAGVPAPVVHRAWEILGRLEAGEAVAPRVGEVGEESEAKAMTAKKKASILPKADPWSDRQLSLFDTAPPNPAVERLKLVDPNRLTPLEALAVLAELKKISETRN